MTDRTPKRHNLSFEILATVALCFGISLILYLLLGFVGRSIVDSYCFYHDVYLDEFELRQLDNIVAGFAFVISALCFSGAFLALFAKKLAYIRKIIAGVHAMQQGNYSHEVVIRGNNELTTLAQAVNYLSHTERDLKKRESELALQREQLIRALSHDIRTPLTSIMSYTELLCAKDKLDEQEGRAYLDLVSKKTAQIKQLTDILLDGGHRNLEHFEHATLLYEQLAGEFEESLEQDYIVSVSISLPDTFKGSFDVGELRRIFDNLISNVQKYADPASPVELRIFCDESRLIISQKNAIAAKPKAVESYQMGIYSIHRIAQNYGGSVEVVKTDAQFEIFIKISDF